MDHPASFGARLRRATQDRGPLCVGVDPHGSLLTDWGLTDDVAGLERFAGTVVEALAGRVAALKPQSAFFERFGSRGIAVLERTIADARSAGTLVVTDAKRGDVGSTMDAYAAAYLDPRSPLYSDAVTLTPYLGYESLRPALDLARRHGGGVFVLALTSNPEGGEVQHAVGPGGGRTVAAAVLDRLAAENAADRRDGTGGAGPGSFGAVVGATVDPATGRRTGAVLDIGGPLLAPGLGAQGAKPGDLPGLFGAALPAVLPTVSRDVLRAGPERAALRAAADRWAGELAEAIG